MSVRTAFRPQVAANLPATAYAARFGAAELLVRVDGSTLDVTRGDGPVDLAFAAGPGSAGLGHATAVASRRAPSWLGSGDRVERAREAVEEVAVPAQHVDHAGRDQG